MLLEKFVEVQGPIDPTVVVYRGVTHQTYSCTPECSRQITLGDTGTAYFDEKTGIDNEYFEKTLGQTTTRNSQAVGAAAASAHRNGATNRLTQSAALWSI